jgi:2-polyprenyl-3-methyl-5-hydroxy-6-metoxy-1,4-benzoquinol methylase
MATQQLDEARSEAFAERMLETLNAASITLMTSVGYRTGLFDTLAELAPSTSQEIADAAELNERYVREWLGAMVTGRVVEYDPRQRTYRLPPEHAASLTRAAGPDNIAAVAPYIPLFSSVESEVIECFRNGGGVPYSAYPGLQEQLDNESRPIYDATLVDKTLPVVPGLVERLEAGIEVADVGCGSGHAINLMAQAFPNSRFTGYDFSEDGVHRGKREAEVLGLRNSRFEAKDVANLEAAGRFDLITAFDTIHDQAQPRKVLKAIVEALRPQGTFLMVDIAASSNMEENIEHPLGPTLYAFSTLHCMTVSLALDGEGLGTAWGEQKAQELLAEAGFDQVDVRQVEGDIFNNYYVASRS